MSKQVIVFQPVSPTDQSVIELINKLNTFQINLYGIENCHLDSPERLQQQDAFMIGAYANAVLVGIGAIKIVDNYGELKRMYVEPDYRGLAIASTIVQKLEHYAREKNIHHICLETGTFHDAAIALYTKMGYTPRPRFGNYPDNQFSLFFEKLIV